MNPILSAALGSILRWGLTFAAGVFVQHGIWTESDATTYVMAASLGLLALGLSLWSKYKGRIKFLTGLAMPKGSTEHDVNLRVDSGHHVPTITTPINTAPTLS